MRNDAGLFKKKGEIHTAGGNKTMWLYRVYLGDTPFVTVDLYKACFDGADPEANQELQEKKNI